MRLHSIKLIGEFKCLKGTLGAPFFLQFSRPRDEYSPICLVGLNGSGKSNLIELISDIFCYANRELNEQFINKRDLDYDFELRYYLGIPEHQTEVKLVGSSGELRLFRNVQEGWQEVNILPSEFLPQNVIAYSSGHNQSLSSVYAKSQFAFFDVVRRQGVFHRNYRKLLDRFEGRLYEHDEHVLIELNIFLEKSLRNEPSLFNAPQRYNGELNPEEGLDTIKPKLPTTIFSDYSANQLTFISLYVLGNEKFREFLRRELNIEKLVSFQIDLRLNEYKEVDFVYDEVQRLALLSSNRNEKDGNILSGIYEFNLNNEFFDAINSLFAERKNFYEVLQFLTHLSAKKWSADEKATLKTSKYCRNVPNISGGFSPIRFINTKIRLVNPGSETLYDRLSDGEHQLIQVIAALLLNEGKDSLFFLDEPESHFNPKWRAEFLALINKYVQTDRCEIMISTHSPFLVSASAGNRVLHFKKDENSSMSIEKSEVETYGASFDSLLRSIFDLPVLISEGPLEEIRNISQQENKEQALQELEKYGESFEVNYLKNRLRSEI